MIAKDVMEFIDRSPTSYHVVDNIRMMAAGFVELDPAEAWQLEKGGRYFLVNDDGAVVLFRMGSDDPETMLFRIATSHSDSPGFRLLPDGIEDGDDHVRLDVEVYGSPIFSAWMDRPLSIAGRVLVHDGDAVRSRLVDFNAPVVTIPNLALHLNGEVNKGHVYKIGKDLVPIGSAAWKDGGFLRALAELADARPEDVLDYDLYLYPYEASSVIGAEEEWIQAPRLDNLATAYTAVRALFDADAPADTTAVVLITDNEEIGSTTKSGGDSTFFANTLRRIARGAGEEGFYRALARSFILSADMTHASHPNYPERGNKSCAPVLGGGVTVKVAASRSYATQGMSAARFKYLMRTLGLTVQDFANPHGQRGGTTIGPLGLRHLDILSADVGIPLWSMHSVRETVAAKDVDDMYRAFVGYFRF